jgi:acyl-CoA thioesterase FadM
MPSLVTTLRVRYAETDRMGVVYYANYFVWFEVARAGQSTRRSAPTVGRAACRPESGR